MKKTLYDTLNVNKNASKDDIKKAYREEAKKAHPDKNGGDTAKMAEINHAYQVLIDPAKRSRYDQTGDDKGAPSFQAKFMGLTDNLLMQIITHNPNVKTIDIVDLMKESLKDGISAVEDSKKKAEQEMKKMQEVQSRMKTKGNDAILVTIEHRISSAVGQIASYNEELEFLRLSIKAMDDYTYKFDSDEDLDRVDMIMIGKRGMGRTRSNRFGGL